MSYKIWWLTCWAHHSAAGWPVTKWCNIPAGDASAVSAVSGGG